MIQEPSRRLFLLGFATLFSELLFIRFLAAYVWNLGYFTNFVLICVFIGIGIGFIFHHRFSHRQSELLFAFLPVLMCTFALLVMLFRATVPGFEGEGVALLDLGNEIYLTPLRGSGQTIKLGLWIFPILAVFLVSIFALLAQQTAKVFRQLPPLQAYSWDIAGSCAGIVVFMLFGLWHIAAQWWFWIMLVMMLPLFNLRERLQAVALGLAIVTTGLIHTVSEQQIRELADSIWSPYQYVTVLHRPPLNDYLLSVNGIGHQQIYLDDYQLRAANAYSYVYDMRASLGLPPPKSVLVIGAGTGNDVQVALLNGAQEVHAVEIDPAIASIGKRYNPHQPYNNPRTRLIIDDGRSTLRQAQRKYDLIIFALTDSLTKINAVSQLRLENFLFTEEAFSRAYELLNDGGTLASYNHYVTWLPDKFAGLYHAATGQYPIFDRKADYYVLFTLKNQEIDEASVKRLEPADNASFNLPTDDWPFLHVQKKSIPDFYLRALMIPGALIFIFIFAFILYRRHTTNTRLTTEPRLCIAFFLMGTAFLLLQTKSVVQYSLLFGNTWSNNSLVFLASLLLILGANHLAAQRWFTRHYLPAVFGLLCASCVLGALLPLRHFLYLDNELLRFLLASLFTFSPLFFANLIFSMAFKERSDAEIYFGWNLLGAVAGGLLEYMSLRFGYSFLSWIVLLCYIVAGACLRSEWRLLAASGKHQTT